MSCVTGDDHVRWSPDRLYWAMLDTSILGRREQRREDRLGYLFEDVLPVPIEEVQAIYRRVGPDRWLACGAARAVIADRVGPDVLALTPRALPPFIDADVRPEHLNLLVGRHEPRRVRLCRRWIAFEAMVLLLLAVLMLGLGVERRVATMRSEITRLDLDRQRLIEEIVGAPAGSAQPPELRLLAERRRLARTRLEVAPSLEPGDAAVALEQLLAAWPRQEETGVPASGWSWRLESIVVDAERIVVRVRVPDTAVAERLSEVLRRAPAWHMAAPTFNASDDGVTVVLRFAAGSEATA